MPHMVTLFNFNSYPKSEKLKLKTNNNYKVLCNNKEMLKMFRPEIDSNFGTAPSNCWKIKNRAYSYDLNMQIVRTFLVEDNFENILCLGYAIPACEKQVIGMLNKGLR